MGDNIFEAASDVGVSDKAKLDAFQNAGGFDKESSWKGYQVRGFEVVYHPTGKLGMVTLTVVKSWPGKKLASLDNLQKSLTAKCGSEWTRTNMQGANVLKTNGAPRGFACSALDQGRGDVIVSINNAAAETSASQPAPVPKQAPGTPGIVGTYSGQGEGELSVEIDSVRQDGTYPVTLGTNAPGCAGSVQGNASLADNTLKFVAGEKDERCEASLVVGNDRSLTVEEGPGCSNHHGAKCSFSGSLKKVSDTVSKIAAATASPKSEEPSVAQAKLVSTNQLIVLTGQTIASIHFEGVTTLKLVEPVKFMDVFGNQEVASEIDIQLGDPARFPNPKPGLKGDFEVSIGCASVGCSIDRFRLLDPSQPRNVSVANATPAAPPSVPTPSSPLIGQWECQSRKPNGTSFTSGFLFTADGTFAYRDPQSKMTGTYQPNGPNAKVAIEEVTIGDRVTRSNTRIDIAFGSARPGQLKFDMTLVTLGTVISNTCVTLAVAAATPAPKVNVCDINPAACAAVQRNNDIRNQVQSQRCEILRSQLRGMAAADYQLAKAGCR